MENGSLDKMTSLYNEVGNSMLEEAGHDTSDLWLYSEAGDGWVDIALFKIGEGNLQWVDGLGGLADAIMALWDAEEPSKRWEAMEFEVHGTEFKTHFWYAGELPPDETGFERRDELISQRFGNFKVIYPPDPAA